MDFFLEIAGISRSNNRNIGYLLSSTLATLPLLPSLPLFSLLLQCYGHICS